MPATTIRFSRGLRSNFSKAAKAAFPKETFAFCFGTRSPKSRVIEVFQLYFPEILLTPDGLGFSVMPAALELAYSLAAANNLDIVATLHSHPYREHQNIDDAAPSETDWEHFYSDLFMGICSVSERASRLTARYRFWPPITKVRLVA